MPYLIHQLVNRGDPSSDNRAHSAGETARGCSDMSRTYAPPSGTFSTPLGAYLLEPDTRGDETREVAIQLDPQL